MNGIIESLKNSNEQLRLNNQQLVNETRDLRQEKDSFKAKVESLNVKMAALEIQTNSTQASATQNQELSSEIDQLTKRLRDLENENGEEKEKNVEMQQEIKSLKFGLQDATQSLKRMYKERDLLKNTITGLLNEIQALKSQVPEQHTFVDFVHLKREYNTLKDEHQKLLVKRKSSKPNILPTLKPEPVSSVPRVASGDSIRTRGSFSS